MLVLSSSERIPFIVSRLVFRVGLSGIVLNRKNILLTLISIEIMLLGINLNFLFFSVIVDDFLGQLFSVLLLTVAASESAIGLAILVIHHRTCSTIAIEWVNRLKGLVKF